jgi:hypothetical protein
MRSTQASRTRSRGRRSGLAFGALSVAAIILAGCGSSSPSSSAGSTVGASSSSASSSGTKVATIGTSANPIELAAASSTAVPGYKLTFSEKIGAGATSALGAGGITATGTGAYDVATKSGSFAFDFGGSSAITSELGSAPLKMVLAGSTIYMHLPAALAGHLPGGKPWIEINLAAAGSALGLGAAFSNPAQTNPGEFLNYLRSTSGSVTTVGSATIGGVATTEYKAVEDLSKYPTILPAAQRAAAEKGIASLEKMTGLTSIPITVWVDGQHLVRQFQLSLSEKTPSTGSTPLDIDITADFPEYGPQTGTAPPPSSEVYDISSAVAGLIGSAASGGAGSASAASSTA